MKKYFVLFFVLTSCQVSEIEPLIFENYFFGEGNYNKFKVEDFYGNYKVYENNSPLLDTYNLSTGRNYANHPNHFSFSNENGKYYLEYPRPASETSLAFFIIKEEIILNNFQFEFKIEYPNDGNGLPAIAIGKGVLNKENRTIQLMLDYFIGKQVFNFQTLKYENKYTTNPTFTKNYLYKFNSKL